MKSSQQLDQLEEEFLTYQVDDLPKEVIDCPNVDQQWHLIGQLKDLNMNTKYPSLSRLMTAVLLIFHSNADCERVFSFVTKAKTKFRASMSTETLGQRKQQETYQIPQPPK